MLNLNNYSRLIYQSVLESLQEGDNPRKAQESIKTLLQALVSEQNGLTLNELWRGLTGTPAPPNSSAQAFLHAMDALHKTSISNRVATIAQFIEARDQAELAAQVRSLKS